MQINISKRDVFLTILCFVLGIIIATFFSGEPAPADDRLPGTVETNADSVRVAYVWQQKLEKQYDSLRYQMHEVDSSLKYQRLVLEKLKKKRNEIPTDPAPATDNERLLFFANRYGDDEDTDEARR